MYRVGYDYLCIEKDNIYFLLKFAKTKKIKILHMRYQNDMYFFYIPTYQRYLFKHCSFPYAYIQTIGFFKYVSFLSRQYLNILGVFCFLFAVIGSSYFIFDIQIIGTLPEVNTSLLAELKKENIELFSPLKSYESLNDVLINLKTVFKDQVEYMNVYQKGSVFYVEYTKRKQDVIEEEDYRNLYAKKDGMIVSMDVDSGVIKVKPNDYVKKGDLLVENTLVSTQNETRFIPVKGHVYAYTFNQYEASIQNVNQDQAEAFYQLLLAIRSQIPTDAVIDKENVLQMTRTSSKITLKMHYTLLEDIAIKGEEDEGSY